jgi:glutamate/aspartate transport system substrate-binding protein
VKSGPACDPQETATSVPDTGRRLDAKISSGHSPNEIETFRCPALGSVTGKSEVQIDCQTTVRALIIRNRLSVSGVHHPIAVWRSRLLGISRQRWLRTTWDDWCYRNPNTIDQTERNPMKVHHLLTAVLISAGLVTVSSNVNAQTLEKIAGSNKIVVSYREAAVPFSYLIDSTKPAGFAVEITEAIIKDVRQQLSRPNLEATYIPVGSQNRIPLLVNGTYDLECGSTTNTSARGKDVAFSISHFYAGTRLLAKKSSGITNWPDLAGKTVASTAGSTNEKVLRKYADDNKIDIQVILGKDYDDALQLVQNGRAVAFAMDDILLFGLRANSSDPDSLEVIGAALQVEPYGCMVRKDDPDFKKLVDGTIARLMRSGEFSKLYAKWFESPIPPKGMILNMPMSDQLRRNLTQLSDQPAM